MEKRHVSEVIKTQKSLTDWLEDINHADYEEFRREDSDKRERLKVINEIIGIPFDKPVQFPAEMLTDMNADFQKYLKEHGQELCAFRLNPLKDGLLKLRNRGITVREAYEWFKDQTINPADYRADFVPHTPDDFWATIFVVNKYGIHGEAIYGGHHQLTFGIDESGPHITFSYDFHSWTLAPQNEDLLQYLKKMVQYIHVEDSKKRALLTQKLDAEFHHNFLAGYFETTDSSLGTWFIDYNRFLGKMFANTQFRPLKKKVEALVSGQIGSGGQATGKVKIVRLDEVGDDFPEGAILVAPVTNPNYVPLMKKAAAIVTDQGGILSHAAIVAREMKKPCLVGTQRATTVLKNDMLVRVDAENGTVTEV